MLMTKEQGDKIIELLEKLNREGKVTIPYQPYYPNNWPPMMPPVVTPNWPHNMPEIWCLNSKGGLIH